MDASGGDQSPRGNLGPLRGIVVLDVATILAGPTIAAMLADFGATVVKIEHPNGDALRGNGPRKDGQPLLWKVVNRNKLGAVLNLSDAEDAETFLDLAVQADVVVENFRPGTLDRWGVGWDRLHAMNPRLILTSVSAFGQSGPYAERPGFGTLAEAMSGFAHITGAPDGPPTLPPFGLADGVCAMMGTWATMMALYERDANGGAGQRVDISILEPLITVLGIQSTVFQQTGTVQRRIGNRSNVAAPRNTYRTADGRWVAVSTSTNSVAERLMRLIGAPHFVTEEWFATAATRAEHVDELDEAVAAWVASHPLATVVDACERAGAAVAPVLSIQDLVADPQVVARGTFTEVQDPELGPLLMPDIAPRLSGTPGGIRTTGPALGEHDEFVRELARRGRVLRRARP